MASAAHKTLELPPKQQQLYDLLKGNGDVRILDMHACVYGETADARELRNAQQRLGPHITRINRRLRGHGQVVRPGDLKGTYRLAIL